VRVLQGAQEEQHVLNVHGHRWYFEPGTPHDPGAINNSGFTNSQAIGISEHFEFDFNDKVAPVFNDLGIADFLYQSAAVDNLWDGMWGLMRTYKVFNPNIIAKLPNNQRFTAPAATSGAFSTQAVGTEATAAPPSPLASPAAIANPPRAGQPLAVDDPVATPTPTTPDPATKDGTAAPPDTAANKTGQPTAPGAVTASGGINQCPTVAGVPIKNFVIEAWLAKDLLVALPTGSQGIVYNSKFNFFDPAGIVYINAADRTAIAAGTMPLEPLVMRVNAGDCINVTLRNRLPVAAAVPEYTSFNELPPIIPKFNFNQVVTSKRVTLHPQVVLYEVSGSDGGAIGFNPDTTVGPGQSINYAWYAGKIDVNGTTVNVTPAEFGVTNLRDYGDVIKHSSHGAIGSLIVEPKGASYYALGTTTPITSGAQADIVASNGGLLFREFVVHYQDDVTMQSGTSGGIGMLNQNGEDDSEDSGQRAFNYRTEPLWARFGLPPDTPLNGGHGAPPGQSLNDLDYTDSLSSKVVSFNCGATPCDPLTPIFQAKPGTNVRFRVAQSAGHARQHGFTLFGHHWNFEPWQNGSLVQGSNPLTFELGSYSGFGPTRHFNILTTAGGLRRKTGDFLYRTQDSFGFGGGLWGIFRVSATAP
jgi:plastocyanin